MGRIVLPARLTYDNVEALVRALSPTTDVYGDLIIDWQHVTFTDPSGLALVSAYCVSQRRTCDRIGFANFRKDRYEARVGIKRICGLKDDYPHYRLERKGRFVDLARVDTGEEATDFARRAAGVFHVSEHVQLLAQYSLIEILTNVSDHTFSRCGAMGAVQKYSRLNPDLWEWEDDGDNGEVIYAVADTGNGIRSEVATKEGPLNAVEAIQCAVRAGFTTGRRGVNQGLGLTVAKAIAVRTGGSFVILSENAMVTWSGTTEIILETEPWPGTCVIGIIPMNTYVDLQAVIEEVEKSCSLTGER